MAPENWVRKQTASSFVLAEFSLPRAEGDAADGRLTITAVGGDVEANVARWRKQFEGGPQHESQQETEVAGVRVQMVDFSGTYRGQHGGVAAATELSPAYRMRAAILALPEHQFIIKCYGPEKTMAEQADAFVAFVRSLDSVRGNPSEAGSSRPESEDSAPDSAESKQPESTESESTESESVEPGD